MHKHPHNYHWFLCLWSFSVWTSAELNVRKGNDHRIPFRKHQHHFGKFLFGDGYRSFIFEQRRNYFHYYGDNRIFTMFSWLLARFSTTHYKLHEPHWIIGAADVLTIESNEYQSKYLWTTIRCHGCNGSWRVLNHGYVPWNPHGIILDAAELVYRSGEVM